MIGKITYQRRKCGSELMGVAGGRRAGEMPEQDNRSALKKGMKGIDRDTQAKDQFPFKKLPVRNQLQVWN